MHGVLLQPPITVDDMRFLAFSDLHLDAPFAQGGSDLANLRRAELGRTLERTVGLAKEMEVDALLCAGDLYEQDHVTPDTVRLLERVFQEMAPIPVLISPGNHDWYGPKSPYRTATWSSNVHIFSSGEMTSWDDPDERFRVWGFAHQKPSGTSNPLERFRVDGKAVHLGLFHGSENSGWSRALHLEEHKHQHAPFSAEHIETAGLTHCVVGHYHQPVEGERYTYGGAPAALSFGAPGNRGAVELVFDEIGELDKREWHKTCELEVYGDLELNITKCGDMREIEMKLDSLLALRSGIGRVTIVGELSPTVQFDLQRLEARRGPLEHLSVRVGNLQTGYDLKQIRSEPSVRGEFVRGVEADEELCPETRQRVIVTGLRALEGRNDLEVA